MKRTSASPASSQPRIVACLLLVVALVACRLYDQSRPAAAPRPLPARNHDLAPSDPTGPVPPVTINPSVPFSVLP